MGGLIDANGRFYDVLDSVVSNIQVLVLLAS